MPSKTAYNFDFRPGSYFLDWKITGEQPKSEEDEPAEENYRVFSPSGFIWANGENLPSFDKNEIEIARIELESSSNDVYSVRASLEKRAIHYRIVDEYETDFQIEPKRSRAPLTMGELIKLIDEVELFSGNEFGKGLTNALRNYNLDLMDGEEPEKLINFVSINSEFYPELHSYYKEEAAEWLESVRSTE